MLHSVNVLDIIKWKISPDQCSSGKADTQPLSLLELHVLACVASSRSQVCQGKGGSSVPGC